MIRGRKLLKGITALHDQGPTTEAPGENVPVDGSTATTSISSHSDAPVEDLWLTSLLDRVDSDTAQNPSDIKEPEKAEGKEQEDLPPIPKNPILERAYETNLEIRSTKHADRAMRLMEVQLSDAVERIETVKSKIRELEAEHNDILAEIIGYQTALRELRRK